MSKRPGAVPEETRRRILESAQKEFSEFGYSGSSLRRIAAGADVTTGAIYFFFSSKDDLFAEIVNMAATPFMEQMEQSYNRDLDMHTCTAQEFWDAGKESAMSVIETYFQTEPAWSVILSNPNHPAVQKVKEQYMELSCRHYLRMLSKARETDETIPEVDAFLVRQYVYMRLDAMLHLQTEHPEYQELRLRAEQVLQMLQGAFYAMLKR